MHFGMGDYASNSDGVTDMLAEIDAVTLDFPSAAFSGSELVLIGVIALLEAASECPCLVMGRFCCILRPSQSSGTGKEEPGNNRRCHFHFHPITSKNLTS